MESRINFDLIETISVDLIVGFGAGCRTANALKRNHLRYFSNPFDWMTLYPLKAVINALTSITKGDKLNFFKECYENNTFDTALCKGIIDAVNKTVSIHDFPKNADIQEAPRYFYLKYIRRFHNLNNLLKKAKTICFLTYRKISLEEMKKFINELKKLYKFKKVYYINIYDTNNPDEETFEKTETEDVTYFIYRFNDEHKNGRDKATNPNCWHGNTEYWDKILTKIKINEKFKRAYKRKRFIFNISNDFSAKNPCCVVTIFGKKLKFKINNLKGLKTDKMKNVI